MRQSFYMNQSGNLKEAVRGLTRPEFLMLLSNKTQFETHVKELEAVGLAAPQVTYIIQALHEKGMAVNTDVTTLEEAEREILKALGK